MLVLILCNICAMADDLPVFRCLGNQGSATKLGPAFCRLTRSRVILTLGQQAGRMCAASHPISGCTACIHVCLYRHRLITSQRLPYWINKFWKQHLLHTKLLPFPLQHLCSTTTFSIQHLHKPAISSCCALLVWCSHTDNCIMANDGNVPLWY